MKTNKKPICKNQVFAKLKIWEKLKAFTLAEIIISMTIIGVIAAITIPALLVSTSEKALEAQKKALFARVSQAMSQIEDLRVYESTASSSSLNFVTKALNKVYRIAKTCDVNDITSSCSFPSEIIVPGGTTFKISEHKTLSDFVNNSSITFGLNTEVAGFVTANGESIAVYYNPRCYGSKTNGFYGGSAASAMCLNMIYDLNSADEAPNEVGKDVGFITVFFPKDPDIVLPIAYAVDTTKTFNDYGTAIESCKAQDRSLILPNWEDGMSIAINKRLSNVVNDGTYLVTGAGSTSAYKMNVSTLISAPSTAFSGLKLRCIYNK